MPSLTERQEALNLTIPVSVMVVGCGGVGSWTAYFLALAGVKKIWLFDGDTISESNLNRIPVPRKEIGQHKAKAVERLIKSIRPDCEVLAAGNFSPEIAKLLAGELGEVAWVVATTDTHASRVMVKKWADKTNTCYIEAAAEGEFGTVTGSPADFATPEENQPGYASVPVWASPCVLSAIIAVNQVVHSSPIEDRTLRMGWGGNKFEIMDSAVYQPGRGNHSEEEVTYPSTVGDVEG
jgi:hypothetical protein